MNAYTGLKAVYDKEILTYFRSPIAYFVIAVFLLGTGFFFTSFDLFILDAPESVFFDVVSLSIFVFSILI